MPDDVDAAAAALLGLSNDQPTGGGKKKNKKKKKKPAAVNEPAKPKVKQLTGAAKLAQQRLQQKKEEAIELEKHKAEEERLNKLMAEEEERLRLEEEEKQRIKREERKKKKGSKLTKAQKAKQLKAEKMRQQLIAQGLIKVDADGQVVAPTAAKKVESEEPPPPTKKVEPIAEVTEKIEAIKIEEEPPTEPSKPVEVEKPAEPVPETEAEDDWENWEDQFGSDKEEAVEEAEEVVQLEQPKPAVPVTQAPQKRELRSPIICVMGHVDTGKTKLLDKLRRTSVQDNEAGGITQQIGATYFPMDKLIKTLDLVNSTNGDSLHIEYKLPGLLVIDTPGHESFSNLRKRGSSLCDIAILVVDLVHGLEPQTIESLELLKETGTPFVVALNKVDRLYGWKPVAAASDTYFGPIRASLAEQNESVMLEFHDRVKHVITELMEQGLNSCLYYDNDDFTRTVSLVPTSAHTGEGLSDILFLLVKLTQSLMNKKLTLKNSPDKFQCSVIEVRKLEGIGTTVDVILVNGELREGDEIVAATMRGPVRTQIKALLTPQPLKEMRVKSGNYVRHKSIRAAAGVKIVGHGSDLENAVAGTQIYTFTKKTRNRDIQALEKKAMENVHSIVQSINTSSAGVSVQASTLGSLEALIDFLRSEKIPINSVNIGPVHKKDVMRSSSMLEQQPEYAVILAFDVKVTKNAQELAADTGVKIFTAEIIYHLFDQFTKYMEEIKEMKKEQTKDLAVFPCILEIIKENVFMKKSPLVFGVQVKEGVLKIGTPIVVSDKMVANPDPSGTPPQVPLGLGKVTSIERDGKPVEKVKSGDRVAIKIEGNQHQTYVQYGRHFDHSNKLVSKISRASIDALKLNFKDELEKTDWMTVIKLKKMLNIS